MGDEGLCYPRNTSAGRLVHSDISAGISMSVPLIKGFAGMEANMQGLPFD